uniref:Xyloglucan endotransglucosylase/hydrolase n=1 Tax=Fagus sylvatica TaxID=28930 RepID=A0A2N9H1C9_FAGSY
MARLLALLMVVFISAIALDQSLVNAKFSKSMYFTAGANNQSTMLGNGDDLQLVLDQTAGTRIQSKQTFLFGSIQMLIKLVPGNSAGTVTAYYVSSSGSTHDEIDFEFLGNVSGQPYIIHTNIYTHGNGSKEQQFYPWFDPTDGFHNYTIHWNPTEIVWYVDSLPIRVFRNYENEGIAYPNKQGMKVYSSLWNADNWATQGGLVKINWTHSPFMAKFSQFRPRACLWKGQASISQCASNTIAANWWTLPVYKHLSYAQFGQLNWVRDNFMIYDYCKDNKRFNGQIPPECFKQQF